MSEVAVNGHNPEYLFWVGCAGSFDARAQRITQAMVEILNHLQIDFAVLGTEESCTGDPAKRAGNEFLFQMQAMQNIEVLNTYNVKKIITACPHCFNTLKNEYPDLGGNYEVIHHSQFLQGLIDAGKLRIQDGQAYKGKKITFHDSCYLGRANDVYEAPRSVIKALDADLTEMKRSRANGLCCGAGGAQVFKDAEKGNKEVNTERVEEAVASGADVVAMSCPFCMVMFQDAVKKLDKEDEVEMKDIAEIAAESLK